VGIGTSEPSAELEVVGSAVIDGITLENTTQPIIKSYIDTDWDGWDNSTYNYGYTPAEQNIPIKIDGVLELSQTLLINHPGGVSAGRWGFHLIDAYGKDANTRLSMIGGKFADTAAIYYYNHQTGLYKRLQLGTDVVNKGLIIDGSVSDYTDDLKVGINDQTPDAALEVVGDLMVSSVTTGDGDLFRITSSGDVGIKTTNPQAALDVGGLITSSSVAYPTAYFSNNVNGRSGIDLRNISTGEEADSRLMLSTSGQNFLTLNMPGDNYAGSTVLGLERNTIAALYTAGTSGRHLAIGTAIAKGIYFSTNNIVRMFLTSGGNLGIGTTEPTSKLEVNGGILSAKVTADPCGTGYPEGTLFYNDTSNYFCYCDGTNDVQMHDPSNACF
jgi:hypothetical protein